MNKDVIIFIQVYEHTESSPPTQVKDPELSRGESDSPEITSEKDLQDAQRRDDVGLNQGKGYGRPDGRLEVSHHPDRKPAGSVTDGAWKVMVILDNLEEQLGRKQMNVCETQWPYHGHGACYFRD